MFHATFALAALVIAGVSATEYNAIECGTTEAVTIKGMLSDVFCTDKSLGDADWPLPYSKTSLLTAPETHQFRCFYDMSVCRDSGYDLLVEGSGSTYEIGHRLSSDLNDKVREYLVGLPAAVKGTTAGFVIQITGAVVYDHDGESAALGAHCGDEISLIGVDGVEGSSKFDTLMAADAGSGSGSGSDGEDDEEEDDEGEDDGCSSCTVGCEAAYLSAKSELPDTITSMSETSIAADATVCDSTLRTDCDAKCTACSTTGENIGTAECPQSCIGCSSVVLCEASETLSTCKVACCDDEGDDADAPTDSAAATAASVFAIAAALSAPLW